MSHPVRRIVFGVVGTTLVGGLLFACRTTTPTLNNAVSGDAASRVYVAPGKKDEFYAFMSGGFSGQVSVYGLPSGRLMKVIPVFSQDPEAGWGYDEESKGMLQTSYGFVPWDDSHHPELSQTNGVPNGKWLFINGNNTPRIARIDLGQFQTQEILQIPNSAGNHSSPFTTPDGKYVVAGTRFSVPIPNNRDESIASYKQNFKGTISFVRADEPGKMDVAFQILVPGFDYDLGHAGKAVSDGWFFFTTYNTEQAHTKLEANASQNDKDFIAAIDYKRAEACVAGGKAKAMPANYTHNTLDEQSGIAHVEKKTSVMVLDPKDCEGLIYFLPTAKSPHGVDVDPTGEYIVGNGKLASVITVHSFTKMKKAIADKAFDKVIDGIPVLKYEAVVAGEVKNPGLGPLHTEFDGKGYAYTSMFISSEIVKWKLGTWEVVDRVPTYYAIGHLMIPGGDSRQPWGKYVIALNKITKDRYLPTGPLMFQSAQLYDISGDKMKLLLDFPMIGEPHYAQALPANLINSVKFNKLAENTNPWATKTEADGGISRQGKVVHVKLAAIRSHFSPDNIEGIQVGDTVYFHVTNIEQDWDIVHGFAVLGNTDASELILPPGETRTLKWIPRSVAVYPFYCTDFCSALHQEMQGYIRVSPAGSTVPLIASLSDRALIHMTMPAMPTAPRMPAAPGAAGGAMDHTRGTGARP
jgi:nitrous-oxide reductase